jgi:hypothetical protein
MGQSIVKWASIAIGNKVSFKEGIVFILSALLVVGLVPILIVLAIVLTADKVSIGLAYTQAIFFVLSAICFGLTSLIEFVARESEK